MLIVNLITAWHAFIPADDSSLAAMSLAVGTRSALPTVAERRPPCRR